MRKRKNLIKKWTEDLNRYFSKDNIHEKMLTITNHQGNANQNHSEHLRRLTSPLLYFVLASRPPALVCPHSRLILGQTLNYKSVIYPQ